MSQRPTYLFVLGILNCGMGCILLLLIGSSFSQMVQFHGVATLHREGRRFIEELTKQFPNYPFLFFAINALLLAALGGLIVSGFGILEMRRRFRNVAIVCGAAITVLSVANFWFSMAFIEAVSRASEAAGLDLTRKVVGGTTTAELFANLLLIGSYPLVQTIIMALPKTASVFRRPRTDDAIVSELPASK